MEAEAIPLEQLRMSVNRGRPFGSPIWVERTAATLGPEGTFVHRDDPGSGTGLKKKENVPVKTARCETTAGNSSVVAESHRRRLRILVHMDRYL